ncbi:uncharacterized protein METZ01_LOCUS480597, partial [marine metagenome]
MPEPESNSLAHSKNLIQETFKSESPLHYRIIVQYAAIIQFIFVS